MTAKIARTKYEPAYKAIRAAILERDGYHCLKCDSTLALEVHHTEGHRHNEPDLLATLCYLCHGVAPMGKVEFDIWMLRGRSGTDVLRERLVENGLTNLSLDEILIFCRTLSDFGYELRVSQLRKARENRKAVDGKCEGKVAYGDYTEERPTFQEILRLRQSGMNCEQIAAELNRRGMLARSGKPWHGSTLRKILRRRTRPDASVEGVGKQLPLVRSSLSAIV